MNEPLLRAIDVHKSYGRAHTLVKVLHGASLDVRREEFLAVEGASGAGKSTLLHILGGLDTPDSGDVLYKGENIGKMWGGRLDVVRNRVFGFVFQFYHLLKEFTALENVMMPQMVRHGPAGWLAGRRKARREARDLLERLGLGERITHKPSELSGGEQQRVAIARALAGSPEILLCDEPTGNLDARTGAGIIDLLLELNREGQTMVVVTHDRDLASMAHRKVAIVQGRIESDQEAA